MPKLPRIGIGVDGLAWLDPLPESVQALAFGVELPLLIGAWSSPPRPTLPPLAGFGRLSLQVGVVGPLRHGLQNPDDPARACSTSGRASVDRASRRLCRRRYAQRVLVHACRDSWGYTVGGSSLTADPSM